jgi:hypothetical protein
VAHEKYTDEKNKTYKRQESDLQLKVVGLTLAPSASPIFKYYPALILE